MTNHPQKKISQFLENFILVAILLVLVQTALVEMYNVLAWPESVRDKLIITGFIFDLIFSVEFIVRSVLARRRAGFKQYLVYERGWVDLLSSLPLLLLDSGPTLAFFLFPELFHDGGIGGIFSSLKTIKAIRVTRILRLLRAIKILGKIQNTESVMANRHVGTISTIAVVTIILVFSIFSSTHWISSESITESRKVEFQATLANAVRFAKTNDEGDRKQMLSRFFRGH
ncbi:MAG: ion transporter, partial [Leptospiraceae bacterium]|nr:ion transporter [Leptospiraceae bacterium]